MELHGIAPVAGSNRFLFTLGNSLGEELPGKAKLG